MSFVDARVIGESGARVSRYPWALVALLWVVSFLNAADRSIVIAVMPQLRGEFGLTPTQLALIASVFFWIYAVAAFVWGQIGDRMRRSTVIIGGLAFWSIATGFVPLSTGFAMLVAFRGLVALGEAAYYPAATALISDWHRPQVRSRALSLHQTAVFAGGGLGALSAGMIADRMGWRVPFLLFGAIGVVVCFVLLKWLRDAPQSRSSTATSAREQSSHPLRIVLKRSPALALCAVFFLANGASTGVLVWAPTYVHDAVGLNLADSALYGTAAISIAGFISVPLGGLFADALAARTPIGRFYMLAIGLTLAAVLLLPLMIAHTPVAIGVVLLASSVGKGLFDGCIYAAMHDVVPAEARATAVGLMTMLGFFGGGLTPIFVAQAGQRLGMAAGLTSLAVLYFFAVAILLLIRSATSRVVLATRLSEQPDSLDSHAV
jgi:MFS family permease